MSFCTSTRKGEMKKICFILFLVFELQPVTCCGFGEYEHQGECCSMCLAGNIVSKHCTIENGTTCKVYAAGEGIEHRNGLEKCFRCKACDQELGLQIKQQCTNNQNTVCESREGYYCIDRSSETGRKHKTCPPGEGVKEKGTHFNDTVCERCPPETYSNNASLTEACKVWTKCEELNQNQVKPGSSTHDVECEKKSNRTAIVVTVLIVVVLIVAVTATVLIWKKKKHKRHTDAEKAKAKRKNHREVPLMEEHEREQYIPSVGGTPMPETRQGTANPNSNKTTGTSLQHQTAGDTSDSGIEVYQKLIHHLAKLMQTPEIGDHFSLPLFWLCCVAGHANIYIDVARDDMNHRQDFFHLMNLLTKKVAGTLKPHDGMCLCKFN